jgi:hypothetical protein
MDMVVDVLAPNAIMASRSALETHMLILEDGPEVVDSEQAEEDHEDVFEGMHASGCDSFDEARHTNEQAEELLRRAGTPS